MIRILYAGVAPFTYGELGLLLNFSQGIRKGRAQGYFLVGENHQALLRQLNLPSVNRSEKWATDPRQEIHRALAEIRPALIIVPDYLSLWYMGPHLGLDANFWRALGVPIVSFDSHGWSHLGYGMDIGGIEFDPTGLGREGVNLAGQDLAMILKLCPFHDPFRIPEDEMAMAMYRPSPVASRTGETIRRRIGCGPDDKLIFLVGLMDHRGPLSKRTFDLFADRFPSFGGLSKAVSSIGTTADIVPRLLGHYFTRLNKDVPIHVVSVSHMSSRPDPGFESQGIHYTQLPMLSEAEYDACIQTADLVVTLNEISGTLIKAVLLGVPAVALINSHGTELDGSPELSFPFTASSWVRDLRREAGSFHPWRYFPVGLFHYYTPLLMDNPLCQTYLRQEIFDEDGCLRAFRQALLDSRFIRGLRERQLAYASQVGRLARSDEILDYLIKHLSLGGG
jgi:hypothetical protein